jgi:hypothetical protein
MASKFTYFLKGIELRGETTDSALNIEGSVWRNSTSSRIKSYIEGAVREVVTNSQSQTLTNKTIAAGSNTISGLADANIASGANIDAAKIGTGIVSTTEFNYLDGVTSAIQTQLNSKESSITATTAADYYRGDKTFQPLNKAAVGLSNVDNTSDATKNSAAVILTNKTIDTATNTITGLANTNIATGANIDAAKIGTGIVSTTEFNYLDGVTSAIQTQINAKQDTITGAATTITTSNLTVSRALSSDASGKVAVSATTSTELGFVSGVTSAIQTQLNAKQGTLTNSAGLAAALSDETGTGSAVFNTSPSLVTPTIDVDVRTNQSSTPASPSAGSTKLYTKTDNNLYILDSTGAETAVGAGASSLGTIAQLKASEGVSVWSTGNNATFLGGGTVAGTFVKNTTTPIHGNEDYKFTQAAGSLNDYIASATQAVDPKFRGNIAFITFNYKYDGANSDIRLVVWDATNSQQLNATNDFISLNTTIVANFMTSVVIPSTCTSIRIGFQVRALNSGKIFTFDDIQVAQDILPTVNVNNVTEWTAYTPSFTNLGSPTNVSFYWKRSGSDMMILGRFTSASGSAAEAQFGFPTGVPNASSTIMAAAQSSNINLVGHAGRSTNLGGEISVIQKTNVNYFNMAISNGSQSALIPANGDALWGGATQVSFFATIPIQGWTQSNPAILIANDQFSTDTASLVYAGSGTYTLSTLTNAPVGTFITFTFAASTNTRTQTTTAPTQTISDMNTNGIQLTSRDFGVTSTAALPCCIAIQIGKGLKGVSNVLYRLTGKTSPMPMDYFPNAAATVIYGAANNYDESTGILYIDAGHAVSGTFATHNFFDFVNNVTTNTAYLVVNASKTPTLSAVPNMQPRIAVMRDVKANNTQGGTATSGAWYTRVLNTIQDDPTGVISSLSSNQFTLPAGEYFIESQSPNCNTDSAMSRIRNITDGSTVIVGTNERANGSQVNIWSKCFGRIVITSQKTFEVQSQVQTTVATFGNGYFAGFATGENDSYTIVKIQKIK